MRKRYTITVEVDEELEPLTDAEEREFPRRIQEAFDLRWPYARRESIRVIAVVKEPENA